MLEQVQLRDGTDAWVTELHRKDRERLAAGFAELSEEARRARFLSPMKQLSETMLDHLVDDVDGIDHVALVLVAETETDVFDPVAIARMVRYDDVPDSADVAVTVKDAWQGRGIASALLDLLVRHRPEGVVRLVTEVQNDNAASLAMLRRLGPTAVSSNGHGAYDVVVELAAAEEQSPESATPADATDEAGAADRSGPTVPVVRPARDAERHQTLHTRDLLCPWLS